MVSACRPAKRQQASLPTHRPPDGAYLASAASSRILLRSISAEDGSRIIFHVKERRLERPAELGSAREPSKLNVAWRRMEVPPTPPVRSRNAVPSGAPGFSTCIEHPMEEHLGWQAPFWLLEDTWVGRRGARGGRTSAWQSRPTIVGSWPTWAICNRRNFHETGGRLVTTSMNPSQGSFRRQAVGGPSRPLFSRNLEYSWANPSGWRYI